MTTTDMARSTSHGARPHVCWVRRERGAEPSQLHSQGVLDASFASDDVEGTLRNAIVRAEDMVVVATFILASDLIEQAILEACARGVRVYLLLPTRERLERERGDASEFEREVLERHERLLDTLAGRVLIRSSASFHAKAVLIDPRRGGRGYLLTANLTTEALSRGHEELAVLLDEPQVRAAYAALRWAAWEAADQEVLSAGRVSPVRPLGRVTLPEAAAGILGTLGPSRRLADEAMRLVDGAEGELVVSSFGWEHTHRVVQRIVKRAREGLRVSVLARRRDPITQALVDLRAAGAAVYGFRSLHAKAIWTDRGEGLVMSANLESQGLDHGFELGVQLSAERAASLDAVLRAWISRAEWEVQKTTATVPPG